MKTKITRRGIITLLIITVLLSLAVYYNSQYGRPMFKGMRIENTFGSSKRKASKPDIWFEDFFGGKKKSDPSKIRR